ncbi:RidA family protein [Uliginosibacterium sediminicola]|uniref:RidA family protein n=1 Tax=Uliginosibacterium sediminicola TaxID=2024550 RepID=A0ABU9YU08_9RHOO
MSNTSRDALFEKTAAALGYSFDGELLVGGKYVPLLAHGKELYISGQIPRVGNTIVVTGSVGANIDLAQGQLAAKICVMRALALLRRQLGSLDQVAKILRITVFVHSAADFTQQSEVADGASEILHAIFAEAGVHTRTSVGVSQLPKNAAVELDMIAVSL